LFSTAARQRFAAFRVRSRIFEVLRFGTPMAGAYQSTLWEKNNRGFAPSLLELQGYNSYNRLPLVTLITL
jgi:hypothetical protein